MKRIVTWKFDPSKKGEYRELFKNYLKKLENEGEKIIKTSFKKENNRITFELE